MKNLFTNNRNFKILSVILIIIILIGAIPMQVFGVESDIQPEDYTSALISENLK